MTNSELKRLLIRVRAVYVKLSEVEINDALKAKPVWTRLWTAYYFGVCNVGAKLASQSLPQPDEELLWHKVHSILSGMYKDYIENVLKDRRRNKKGYLGLRPFLYKQRGQMIEKAIKPRIEMIDYFIKQLSRKK